MSGPESLGRPWGRDKAGFAKDAVAAYSVASYIGRRSESPENSKTSRGNEKEKGGWGWWAHQDSNLGPADYE